MGRKKRAASQVCGCCWCTVRFVTMVNSLVVQRHPSLNISRCWRIASRLIQCLQVLRFRYMLSLTLNSCR